MSEYYTKVFNSFNPQTLDILAGIDSLRNSVERTGLLICGESHGSRENADIIYTLCKLLGVKRLAIERPENHFKSFVESALNGKPNFLLPQIMPSIQASVLSVELLKTISMLVNEKSVDVVSYIDSDLNIDTHIANLNANDFMREREVVMARNIQRLDTDITTLVLLGRYHTRPEYNDGDPFPSTLNLLRRKRPAVLLEYVYHSGEQYNAGTLYRYKDTICDTPGVYTITKTSNEMFKLHIPKVHRIKT